MNKSTKKDVLKLAKDLISIPSISTNGHTSNHVKALRDTMSICNKVLTNHIYRNFVYDHVPSRLYYNANKMPRRFKIILNAHLDVVDAKEKQFIPHIKEDKLYGRGAYDMKASASVMIYVFKELADRVDYPLGLQLVTDEEMGGENGTRIQIDNGVKADFVIIGEPTNFDIVYMSKGKLVITLKSKGRSAHAAYPWLGNNAISTMIDYLQDIQNMFPTSSTPTWNTTLVPSIISTTNSAHNNVPNDCTAQCDIRFSPGNKKMILKKLRSILPDNMSLSVEIEDRGSISDKNDTHIRSLAEITSNITCKETVVRSTYGSSDAKHYPLKTVAIEFGPIGAGHHSDNEWVSIKSLESYYTILKNMLLSLNRK